MEVISCSFSVSSSSSQQSPSTPSLSTDTSTSQETLLPSSSTSTSETTPSTTANRAKWNLEDTFALVDVVHSEGKNWEKDPPRPRWTSTEKQCLGLDSVRKKEAEAIEEHNHTQEKCTRAIKKVKEVEDQEVVEASHKRKKMEEVNAQIKEEEEQKRTKREERLQEWEASQQSERAFHNSLTRAMQANEDAINKLIAREDQLVAAFKTLVDKIVNQQK